MYQHGLAVLLTIVITMGHMSEGALDGALDPVDDGEARWNRAAELFNAWREGSSQAIDDLVRLMTPVLWHVVRAYGLQRAETEDVIQTTWLRLVRGHTGIDDSRAVSAWLTTTARREAWRVGKAGRRVSPTEDAALDTMLPTQVSAELQATTRDEYRRLWSALRSLAGRCQRLLRVIAFEDRPDYARLADDLAMPVGSIGPTRRRCLEKLRELLNTPPENTEGQR